MNKFRTFIAGILVGSVISAGGPAQAAKKPKSAEPAAPASAAAPKGLLDAFDVMDWATANHEATTLAADVAPGLDGNALHLVYDLKDSKQWVAVSKPFSIPSFQGKALDFWVKGTGKSNVLEIKVVDTDGSNFGVKKSGLTNKAEWTRVTVNEADLTYWWDGDKTLGAVKEVHFAISADQGGAGELSIDQLRLIPARQSSAMAADGTIADGETTEGWAPAQADGAKLTLGNEPGQSGKALALSYAMPENQWVSVRRTVNTSIPAGAVFVFKVRGQGDTNNIEFKIVDRDESVFGKVLEGQAANGAWEEVRVPVSELAYMWGGDNQLDSSLIRHIDLAISGPGGKGKVWIDDLKVVAQ